MRPNTRIALIAVAAILAAHLGDRWAWQHVVKLDVYDHDLGRMLRTVGFLPIWLLLGVALWLQTRERRPALLLALVPTVSAILCAVLQVLVRRERPGLHDGAYVFRAFADRPFHGAEFGLPSSHAMVAFSGAWVLCRLYPKASVIWLVLAAGCAWSRVAAQAHFLSDVTVAAVAAWMVVAIGWKRWGDGQGPKA